MKSFRSALVAGSLLLFGVVFLTFPHAAYAQGDKQVNVINTPANPVPVRSVDNAARQAFQVAYELNAPQLPVVPAGKIFVIEYVSGRFRVPSATGATGQCKFFQLSLFFGSSSDIDVIPVLMGTAPSISNDINFFTISQAVRAYAGPNSEIGGASFSLSPFCSGFPTSSRIVLTGHLENAN